MTYENSSGLVRRLIKGTAIVVMTAGLAGCANLLEVTGPAPNLFDLSPKSTFPPDLPSVNWQLVIEEPVAARAVDTDRVALRPSPMEVKYFAGVRWADRAPRLVQTLLVESFENSGKIVAVGRQAVGLRSDFSLKSELREFYAEYTENPEQPTIRVRLNVKLVAHPAARIVASQTFEKLYLAESNSVQHIVTAFDKALGSVMRKTVQFALTEGAGYKK